MSDLRRYDVHVLYNLEMHIVYNILYHNQEVLAINKSKLDNSINDGKYISLDMFSFVKVVRGMVEECSFP